jgi:hypothetical protein
MVTVVSGPDGDELTIWDSQESEFATGLEYCGMFRLVHPNFMLARIDFSRPVRQYTILTGPQLQMSSPS